MAGRALGLVVATGLQTEVGKIAEAVTGSLLTKPPLVIRMERFARQISLTVLGMIVLLALTALAEGTPLVEVFFISVALAVSAIPEGLPVAMTVALAIATSRMAKRNVIVRRLTAVEGLGSCTCIASDKTGTLTVNRQTARVIWLTIGDEFIVSGEGHVGEGEVKTSVGQSIDHVDSDSLKRLAKAAVICNEAELGRGGRLGAYRGCHRCGVTGLCLEAGTRSFFRAWRNRSNRRNPVRISRTICCHLLL